MIKLPTIRGTIDRRILINYRVAPDIARKVIPKPFRPKILNGWAIGGICLIRLSQIRPARFPGTCGFSSENAAHRFAVEWNDGEQPKEGVFILRRDSNSRINSLFGGTVFPGVHHHCAFQVHESNGSIHLNAASDDRKTKIDVFGTVTDQLPDQSIFPDLPSASRFFERGSLGYSVTNQANQFDGLELRVADWKVRTLAIESVYSSFFNNPEVLPAGAVEFDCALWMANLKHEWHSREPICCELSTSEHA